MTGISRRTFARTLIAASAFPAFTGRAGPPGGTPPPEDGTVAGYTPTDEERRLMDRFLVAHEERMVPLRTRPLPNELAPLFSPHPDAARREKP